MDKEETTQHSMSCEMCNGSGKLDVTAGKIPGVSLYGDCPNCGGSGKTPKLKIETTHPHMKHCEHFENSLKCGFIRVINDEPQIYGRPPRGAEIGNVITGAKYDAEDFQFNIVIQYCPFCGFRLCPHIPEEGPLPFVARIIKDGDGERVFFGESECGCCASVEQGILTEDDTNLEKYEAYLLDQQRMIRELKEDAKGIDDAARQIDEAEEGI